MTTDDAPTKLLLAEDQLALRQLLARRLRDLGFDVVEVGDGAVLWQELHDALLDEDNPREVELIITDLRMPRRGGLEVLELLRRRPAPPPVIVMTAFGDAATHAQALALGAARVFDKPFALDELLAEVRRLTGRE